MNFFIKSVTAASLMFFAFASNVLANPLSGKEAYQMLTQEDRVFDAGSIGEFNRDGTYTFTHTSDVDKGEFTVYSDGRVVLDIKSGPRAGQKDVVNVVFTGNRYRLHYIEGRLTGSSYAFK